MLTVLNDSTLRCDDCLTEDMEDSMYSETALGTCDECGALTRRYVTQETAVVVGRTIRDAEAWSERYLRGDVVVVATAADSLPKEAAGLRVRRENVVMLPGSEDGLYANDVEHELMRAASSFDAGYNNFLSNKNVAANFNFHMQNAVASLQKFNSTFPVITGVT